MMSETNIDEIDDDLLKRMVAYADGELGPEEEAAFEAILKQDDRLAGGVESLRKATDLVREFFPAQDDENAVPAHLVDLVRETPIEGLPKMDKPDSEGFKNKLINSIRGLWIDFNDLSRPFAGGALVALAGLAIIGYGVVGSSRLATVEDATQALVNETQALTSRLETITSEAEKRSNSPSPAEEEVRRLASELTQALSARRQMEQELASMTTALVQSDLAKQNALSELKLERLESRRLTATLATVKAESWIGELARYYSLYAGQTMQRHLVEVPAVEIDHIKEWLGDQLDRRMTIPDLSAEGLRFVGARLLDIGGNPTGQLTYVDDNERITAFCVYRNEAGGEGLVNFQDGGINIVRWRDQELNYVVVGENSSDALSAIARFIRDEAPSI